MDPSRWLALATVVLVVGIAVAAGPLVGGIDVTPAAKPPPAPPGTGAASVDVVTVPNESIRLVRGAFGAGTYHLEAPAAVLAVGDVSGNPTVEYLVRIPGLGYADVRIYSLHDRRGDRLGLRFRPAEISPARVKRDRYDGRLAIRLQADEHAVLHESKIVVEVVG